MIWTFSDYRVFQKCQRRWFYRRIFANARATDPQRREAHRLSRLVTVAAWRGKVVDDVISTIIVPGLRAGRKVQVDEAKRAARNRFEQQKAIAFGDHDTEPSRNASVGAFGGLFELEYREEVTAESLSRAEVEIDQALDAFYSSPTIWHILTRAESALPQQNLSFSLDGVTVRGRPDLVTLNADKPPAIIDWKVQANPLYDHRLQLVAYAVCLARCVPHRDWPPLPSSLKPASIKLLEVQLLTRDLRWHSPSESEIDELDQVIASSSTSMALARGDRGVEELHPEDFAVARDPRTCQRCEFRKICWGDTS